MGLFSRKTSNATSAPAPVRRPVADPDSDAIIWVTSEEAKDAATVDRLLAEARKKL